MRQARLTEFAREIRSSDKPVYHNKGRKTTGKSFVSRRRAVKTKGIGRRISLERNKKDMIFGNTGRRYRPRSPDLFGRSPTETTASAGVWLCSSKAICISPRGRSKR